MVGCGAVGPLEGADVGGVAAEDVPVGTTGTGSADVGTEPGAGIEDCGEKPAATYSSVFHPARVETTPTPMTRPPDNDAANFRRRRRS